MIKSKIVFFSLLALSLFSCKMTKIYYHNTQQIDDGEIWGSNLKSFFIQKDEVKITKSSSIELSNELLKIKNEIQSNGKLIDVDDDFYDYAFVLSKKDTLYSKGLIHWRYDEKTLRIESSMIKKLVEIEALQ